MLKKLNIADRFELAVPADDHGVLTASAVLRPVENDGFPEPVSKKPIKRTRDVTREQGILNYPTHHKANLTAIAALYRNTNPTGV